MAPLYPHDVLVSWAAQHGGYFHNDVEVALTPEKGYHIVVRRNVSLAPNTQVVTCPMPCTMSILNVIDAEGGFTCRGIKLPPSFIQKQPRETVERFFLMEQYLVGKKSWWAPYIATLPTPEEVRQLQFEKAEDLIWIKGTNLANALEKQTAQWKQFYEQGTEQLLKLNWQNAKSGRLTWDLFRWASTIFTSRSFTSQVLDDTLPADKARPMGRFSKSKTSNLHDGCGNEHTDFEHLAELFSEGFPVLIPVLDILNYRPLAQVEWQARCSYVGLEVLEAFKSGEEVYNNYGPRDNETLLLGYAFAVPNNPFDHFSVALRLPPQLSLTELRPPPPTNGGHPYNVVPLNPRDLELKCYVFKPEHPRATDAKSVETALFSLDLLDGISVLRATDREWQAMRNFKKTYFAEGLENGRFEDSRNLLATISQLLIECKERLKTLKESCPAVGLAPRNLKQIFAHIYRESQVDILQIATCLCEVVLRRATGCENETNTLERVSSKAKLDDTQTARLRLLLQRHKYMSMQNELFSFDHLLGELPATSVSSLRYVLTELDKERRLNTNMEVELTLHNIARMELSLTLSALLAENTNGSLIEQRIKSWVDQLTQWYPPDSPEWHYVPNRRATSPGEEPPSLLLDLLDNAKEVLRKGACPDNTVAWLQPKMLAWAWNVMEEEGVDIPREVVDDQEFERDPKEMAFLLFYPQLGDRDQNSPQN